MVTHDIILRGLDLDGRGPEPTILRRVDQAFIPAILQTLRRDDGLTQLAASHMQRPVGAAPLKLFQPVHRVFHVAVCELICDTFGEPRFDPRYIDSAGLVMRRVTATDGAGQATAVQGWMDAGGVIKGWMRLDNETVDPDPKFRRPEISAGHPEITRRIALYRNGAQSQPVAESSTPLFVAPPDVCAATKKTLLYGLVSVASAEFSEAPTGPPSFDDRDLTGHISKYLRPSQIRSLPVPGQVLTVHRDASTGRRTIRVNGTAPSRAEQTALDTLTLLVQQLAVEFGAFGASSAAKNLYRVLNEIALPMPRGVSGAPVPAGDFLAQARGVLLERDADVQVTMPLQWPAIDEAQATKLLVAIKQAMQEQLATLSAGQKRFDERGRLYQLRAFARVVQQDDCPPTTIWSHPSPLFTIVPWYEPVTDPAPPPVQVALPNPFDRDAMKQLKPNVAFHVPRQLADFLESNSPDDMLSGDAKEGQGSIALDWICGFNIPFITLCAFIVLSIFLSLFNLVFQWLLFIKICIPFPRRDEG